MSKGKNIGRSILLLYAVLQFTTAAAQPFAEEIAAFRKNDSIEAPPRQAILFVGSSSFRKWTDVQDYFPGHTIINRGFGGSTLPDLIRYAPDIIYPYHPKQVVIYCGENDLASSDTITATVVLQRFKTLFNLIRTHLPGVPVLFVGIKPCPSRWRLEEKMREANKRIRKYLKKRKNAAFVSTWKPMLGEDGKPVDSIFIEDKLHMNASGYAIWKKLIEPYLIK
jgi:lysophospholipase L1-like esterase